MQANRRYLFFSMTGILATLLLSAAINLSSGDRLSGTASKKIKSDQSNSIAQAAPPSQSAEDLIRATLEEANQSLGGVFSWRDQTRIMDRPPISVGTSPYDEEVFLRETLIIDFGEFDSTCGNQGGYSVPESFHGMRACLNRKPHYQNQGYPTGLWWQPYGGIDFNGQPLILAVFSGLNPTCAGYDAETEASCGDWTGVTRPIQLAEALHQAAINNGLYEAVPGDESTLIDPGEVVPGQPESPTDQIPLSDSSKTGNIPWPIILASLGIPVTGALAGSIVSAILASRSVDEMAKAGEEFVSQVGDQVQLEADGNAKLSAQQLQALDSDLQAINVELTNRKIYVLNPYQGDPTVVGHKILTGLNVVLNNTAGRWTGQRGLSCEDYVNETQEKIVEIVSKRFPGAKVENMIFEENSTVRDQKSWGDWFDSFVDDNHNLTRVTLPDGSEWAVDFHQKNAGKAPLMRSWSEARAEWKEYLGKDEFNERSRKTFQTEPKPPK